jgi:hypothetical protein
MQRAQDVQDARLHIEFAAAEQGLLTYGIASYLDIQAPCTHSPLRGNPQSHANMTYGTIIVSGLPGEQAFVPPSLHLTVGWPLFMCAKNHSFWSVLQLVICALGVFELFAMPGSLEWQSLRPRQQTTPSAAQKRTRCRCRWCAACSAFARRISMRVATT